MLRLFAFVIVALTPSLFAMAEDASSESEIPNVVLFLVDDMGLMDTSLPFLTDESGKPQRHPLNLFYRTPNMARLAANGVRFNNFYAMSVCSPSRASIMTGQNAARHRTTNWINPGRNNRGPSGPPTWNWMGLSTESVTLPRLLQSAGYRTIHIGKGHFGPKGTSGADPRNLGFDENVGGADFGHPASYFGEKSYGHSQGRSNSVPHLEKYHGSNTFLTEALTLEAKARVAAAVEGKKPFFLYFSHYAVHAPFDTDPRFVANYEQSKKSKRAIAFATLVEGVDKSLGDILDQLESLGVADNTLVIFLGDNGTDAPLGPPHEVACAAPLRGKKGAHYEGGIRVPFIAAWAKNNPKHPLQSEFPMAAGLIQTQITAVTDLFPTILNWARVPSPSGHAVDGSTLAPLLSGAQKGGREGSFLMHYPHSPHRSDYFTSYRKGDWKVIYHYLPSKKSEGERYQLFNLAQDPFESTNVAATESARLSALMLDLVEELSKFEALYPVDEKDTTIPLRPIVPEG